MCGGTWIIKWKSLILGHEYILQNIVLFSEKGIRGMQAYRRTDGDQDQGGPHLVYISHLCNPWFWIRPLSIYGILATDKGSGVYQKDFRVRSINLDGLPSL